MARDLAVGEHGGGQRVRGPVGTGCVEDALVEDMVVTEECVGTAGFVSLVWLGGGRGGESK